MVIVRVMGGLGNQMQQYALYTKLKTLGRQAKLDLSWFTDPDAQSGILAPRELELKRFVHLPMVVCTQQDKEHITGGSGALGKLRRKLRLSGLYEEKEMYDPEVLQRDNAYLTGYWACTAYYADILEQLKTLFAFPAAGGTEVQEKNEHVLEQMRSGNEISAAIHLRRGDYLDKENAGLLGGICTPAYYEGAVRLLEERFSGAQRPLHFYVFSDDSQFAAGCRFGTKGEKITLCDWNKGADNMLDMELMANAQCIIAANSTFSFWGGRLNLREDAVRIRPLRHRNNQIPDPAVMHRLWKGWELVDRDGTEV
ncbi:MAG: alpha-1,2-fucosyltransferase [Lachnospiraceae bacterium]|nr:alpha-1,2-fucosyltransferase [Lachnospiraceae bacterium]